MSADTNPGKDVLYKPTAKQREAVTLCAGDAESILLKGGGRSGKTFTFVRNIIIRAAKAPESRHAMFRLTGVSCKESLYLDTYPKVLRDCFPDLRVKPVLSHGYDRLPNGSEIWFAGLDDKERIEKILGKEYATVYFNECSQIPYATTLTVLTRLAQKVAGLKNRAYYDLNPLSTTHWTERLFIQHVDPITRKAIINPRDYAFMTMNPVDNIENIDPRYLERLKAMPERFQARFLYGLAVNDMDNALWTLELIERSRVASAPKDMDRITVSVDPSGAKGEEDVRSDEIGINVMGRKREKAYVLEDGTMRGSPEQWGKEAVRLYKKWNADAIIGEVNYGGDMVRATIHAVDRNIRFKPVTATRGKVVRAEPVSALYTQGLVHHVGTFAQMEDEMSSFTADGYKGDRSPNRADAMVWNAHELMLTNQNTGLLEFYRMDHERRMGRAA